jgi:hypothetical protein
MPCIEQSLVNEESNGGIVLPLASEVQNNCILFFPVSDEVGDIVNYLMEVEGDENPEQSKMVDVFKTMINTWRSGERFLSGIFIDLVYDLELNDEVISVNLMLSSSTDGCIEAVIKVNFVHAIIVAILEDIDVMVSNEVLNKLLPEILDEKEDDLGESLEDKAVYPVDDDILEIAKRIMDGKIK